MRRQIKIGDITITKHLSSFGDVIVNFIYSCAWTLICKKPYGFKVSSCKLAKAISMAGLRSILPSGLSTHDLANIYEALTAYVFLSGSMNVDEMIGILSSKWKEISNKNDADIYSLACLLREICKKIRISS